MIAALRRWLVVTAVAASAACAPRASERAPAAVARQSNDGVVLLVQTPQHLDVALLTARELVASNEAREVRVLACGPAVSALQPDGAASAKIADRDRAHVRVLACGLSLERAGIAPSALAPEIEVVPNGIVEVLRLQRAGFRSVEL